MGEMEKPAVFFFLQFQSGPEGLEAPLRAAGLLTTVGGLKK